MGHQSPSDSSPALSISASPSYHLFSTFVIIAWTLFIGATVIVHELAHRMTWDPSRVASGAVIPWAFRPSTGLPNILRIVFSQAHGPITAMHLARLAITAPEVVWASPKTWMEVFWLSDRRWAGPVGLAKTGWTLASRRLRVSLTFCLLAALSIIALATPLVMSNAYPVKTNDVEHQITVQNVTMLDLPMLSVMLNEDQLTIGGDIWSKGLSPPELLPRNAYAETGMQSTASGGAWFFSGGSSKSEMLLTGIRVAGGCEVLPTAAGNDRAFQDRCKTEFGADLNPDSFVTQLVGYIDPAILSDEAVRNVSTCSNIGRSTSFGRESASTALLRLWTEKDYPKPDETLVRCSVTAGPGTASVNGLNMTFNHFTYSAPSFDEETPAGHFPLDPVAAIMQWWRADEHNLVAFQKSLDFKMNSALVKGADISVADYHRPVFVEVMWDGLLSMAAELWFQASQPVERTGIQRLTTSGIRRDDSFVFVLAALLGVWFVGMLAGSLALLRPTWAGSLDGYAAARMLQHRPDLVAKPEAQYAELEENEDLLEAFTPGQWRSPKP